MNPYSATLVNAFTLITMGLWGYFAAENGSVTALIPVGMGLLLLVFSNGVNIGNKKISGVVFVLTLLIVFSLYMPFKGAMEREDTAALVRVLLMIGTGVVAVMSFAKAYLKARKTE